MLSANNLEWSIGGADIVKNVSLSLSEDEFLGIVGPNGSGKTSLMALLSGLRKPRSGGVFLDGTPMNLLQRRDVARQIALV